MPVYLPLEKLDKCAVCEGKKKLLFCSACFERGYCSKECQVTDWKSGHKKKCFKAKMIDLETIVGFLACIADLARSVNPTDLHPAQKHQIINSPNPGFCEVEPIPGSTTGEAAVLVKLGKPIPMHQVASPTWWPKAYSLRVRNKLNRRLNYEGRVFPLHFAIAFALLDIFYTDRVFRLKYRTSPIADFGLACGKFRVMNQDKLAYVLPDGSVLRGQDPENHWWIYFITARGEELTLDVSAFTWNLCMMVPSEPYVPEPIVVAPLAFRNREIATKSKGVLYTEKTHHSILRDVELGKATDEVDSQGKAKLPFGTLAKWAEYKIGTKMTEKEKIYIGNAVQFTCYRLAEAMFKGDWKKWPETHGTHLDLDPLEEFASTGIMPPRGG